MVVELVHDVMMLEIIREGQEVLVEVEVVELYQMVEDLELVILLL